MDRVLIHIGYHKTGTTWLQNNLFIQGNEFFEPISKNAKGHSTIAWDFIINKEGYLLSPLDSNENFIKNELKRFLKQNSRLHSKYPVISSERLSGDPHSSGFDSKTIANRLHNIFPKAKILIGIREQKKIIASYVSFALSS